MLEKVYCLLEYISGMKYRLFNVFNMTLGRIFRAIQMTLNRNLVPAGVHHLVNQTALQESANFAVKNFQNALIFNTREQLWEYVISIVKVSQHSFGNTTPRGGVITEFGVWKGESINFFAKHCAEHEVFGFDSFEGLEENWSGYRLQKGFFSTNGVMPRCEPNVKLLKGWFEDTVPGFLNQIGEAKISLLHLDADTYKPTAYVLGALARNIQRGTVILFDEFFGYPNYQSHEYRAWHEFLESYSFSFRYIAYTEKQVAVEIM